MIYIFKKHNYNACDAYARITHSKKACFNYFNKLKQDNINKLCVYNDEWKLNMLLVVIITYMNI